MMCGPGHPGRLLDALKASLRLQTDAELAQRLATTAATVSKVRNHRLPIADWLLISMHEETGWGIHDLRRLAGAAD